MNVTDYLGHLVTEVETGVEHLVVGVSHWLHRESELHIVPTTPLDEGQEPPAAKVIASTAVTVSEVASPTECCGSSDCCGNAQAIEGTTLPPEVSEGPVLGGGDPVAPPEVVVSPAPATDAPPQG